MGVPQTDLHVEVWGSGEPVLLVHGSLGGGEEMWYEQRELADRYGYALHVMDRHGFGSSPRRSVPHTFAQEAEEVAGLLGRDAHLVGLSYGGVLALLAAARRPEAVRSLTVIEPPAFSVARGNPDVEAVIARLERVYRPDHAITAEEFRLRFWEVFFWQVFGFFTEIPPLSPQQRKDAEATIAESPPWEADIPLDVLARAPFPKLIVSSGVGGATDSAGDVVARAFDAVCHVLTQRLGADHAVIRGAGHGVQYTGAVFNERLASFLASSSHAYPGQGVVGQPGV